MVYWEYNLGITERNMEIKEYTKFKADEILQLYTQVGWMSLCKKNKTDLHLK